ncbi:N-acetylmuramoyl-L-alanine amidase [Sedimentibacter saalensis]|uniref:N-acetylmuramoyl-L-alanine amidase n=1 Tax=Sedimentibacter saalensis TaxID=130788 RepID=UPI00289D68A8|nr:N-acetylmuramoyl-L-alanine amidase [Sedimentibacter saalensis]
MKKILLLASIILALSMPEALGDEIGYTNISNIALYKSDNYTSNVVDTLKINSRISIVKESKDWYNVKTQDGKTGWIEKYFVTVPADKYVKNNTEHMINIRTAPTTTSKQVGQLSPGEKAKYIDTYHSWHIIEYKGTEYYIASWLTDIEYDESENVYFLYDNINIRDTDSVSGNVVAQGNKYDSFEVCGEKSGWLKLKLPDGQSGYVAAWLTSYNMNYYSEGTVSYKKTTDDLNIRTGPSTKDKKVLSIKKGSSVIVVDTENGWDKIVDKKGNVGWCNNSYLKEVLPLSGKKILLDPGHGGKDPGSISFTGKFEKYVNMDVALMLKEKLENLGATVYLTRNGDTYIKNSERGRMADKLGCDILLSIHHNSLNNSDYFGLSTYYNTKNFKDKKYGYNLAESIYLNAVTVNGVYRDGILDRNYEVLRETKTPAALIEIGFMSNPKEEMNIHNSSFQNIVVEKIAAGITDYFNN